LQGEKEVNLDHIAQIAPYVLWHRIKWSLDSENKFMNDKRTDPLELHIAKSLLGDGTNEMPGVKKRFSESRENYQRVIDLVGYGKTIKAIREAEECYENGKGHPIFADILNDLRGK
jgi:hypothetical protein